MVRVIVLFIGILWFCYRWHTYSFDDLLHVVFCDVGQGDATIIRYKNTQMLIDGGGDSAVLKCLDTHVPPWDRQLEVIVATHPDADHISGLVPVLQNYQVKALLHNGQGKETADFDRFKDAVKNEAIQGSITIQASQGVQIKLSNEIDLSVIYPYSDRSAERVISRSDTEPLLSDVDGAFAVGLKDTNDHSIVLKITYKNIDMLLMGDLEEGGEKALIDRGLIADVEVLKVGHHGAKTSTTPTFLGISRPEISVISAGKNNSYGHPSPLVIERLTRAGSLIFRTDQDSSIELVSNGYFLKRKDKW